jgi:large subunit ribosomal protein L4
MENISTKLYSVSGKESGSVNLPSSIWNLPWNGDLVHQVVIGMQANARASTANAKGRGEVSGGGKKPWRQKGTGRARHGSNRSPIWIGGGTTHGPLAEKNYEVKINKKMKAKALFVALSQKLRDNQIVFVDSLAFDSIKTKSAQDALNNLEKIAGFETINTKKHNNIFVVVPTKDEKISKSFRNLAHATLEDVRNLNPMDVMNYRYIVMANPEEVSTMLGAKMTSKAKTASVKSSGVSKKVAAKKVTKKAK